jgi:hypothetical protein
MTTTVSFEELPSFEAPGSEPVFPGNKTRRTRGDKASKLKRLPTTHQQKAYALAVSAP